MSNDELKQKLFEVMFALDDYSAGRDFVSLRNQHYKDMIWVNSNGMQEEYYNYLFSQIKPRLDRENEIRARKRLENELKEVQK